MAIQLDENYRVERDTCSWALVYEEKKFDVKRQKEYLSTATSWHATFKQALTVYCDLQLAGFTSAREIISAITHLEKVIKKLDVGGKQ